jgi:hypothetical protein
MDGPASFRRMIGFAVSLALVGLGCTGTGDDAPQAPATESEPSAGTAGAPVIAAVGDLVCAFGTREPPHHAPSDVHGECEPEKVARLVTRGDYDAFLPLGDLQYSYGSLWRFEKYWDRYYGSVFDITYPVPGNHEAYNGRFMGYFEYFGDRAHPPGGYYSFDLGSWHVIALNSQMCLNRVWGLHTHLPSEKTNTGFTRWESPIPGGGCKKDDPMMTWLQDDLAAHPNEDFTCTLAYFHHPAYRWAGSVKGLLDPVVSPLWKVLHASGVDVVLTGHQHDYQRWVPMDAEGQPDSNGMESFIVGTGGDSYQPLPDESDQPDTVAQAHTGTYGVLEMTLGEGIYEFAFVPAEDQAPFEDAGSGTCH